MAAGSARVPTTVDEATADPPPVAPTPAPRPHAGMPTVVGHAVGPVASLGPAGSPAPRPHVGIPTTLGHAVAPAAAPFNVGKTLFDPAPYGQIDARPTDPGEPSQVPTPMVPPPNLEKALSQTVSDPHVTERARQIRDTELAEARGKTVDAEKGGPPRPRDGEPVFGKTLVLGGATAADFLPKSKSDDIPTARGKSHDATRADPPLEIPAASRPSAHPTDPSPLSISVCAPTSWAPPAAGGQTATSSGMQPAPAPAMQPAPAPAMQPAPAPAMQPAPMAQPAPTPALAGTQAPANMRDAAASKADGSDKKTMLGMPAIGLPQPPPHEPQVLPSAAKTMLGVAMPGIAPTREKPPAEPQRAGTLLGVAVPGIAPLRAGDAQPNRSPQPTPGPLHPQAGALRAPVQAASPPPIVPAPAPLVVEPLPEAPPIPAKKGVPAIAVVGIVFVLVTLIGGGAALLILRPGAPLTAQPQLDETGKELLKIGCESCPDGTVITLGASSTKVQGATALLPLPAPLSIGDNDLEMTIDRPAPGRDETVKVHVPVAYRVKADLSTLTSLPPSITVRVEALPETDVTVDGMPTSLDASGKASVSIDVAAEVEGKSDEQKTIDKKIPFTIKSKGAAPENGQLVVRAVVTPLHLDAPGLELYTDRPTAAISGQTKPGGTLTVDGQPVTLDAQGRFGVRVELPGDGEKSLTIVANAPPLAPRTVRAKVVRVVSLDMAAKALEAKAPLAFDAFGGEPASKIGKLVVVDGEVLEVRVAQGHTILLVEEKKACGVAGACVVRIVHGDEVKAARGDSVRIFGHLEGTVSSGGKTVPDIEGVLALVRAGARK